ncbi:MAG: hypothetical protein PHQ12_04675 [Chthoniobacteraceae bacterium]|nr:hypothetical protein [Chthoniobacteraceae bacterium]
MNETLNPPPSAASPDLAGTLLPLAEERIISAAAPAIAEIAAPFFSRLLSDAAGNPSSMRLLLLVSWGAVIVPWAVLSIRAGALQPLPESVVALLSLPLAGKLWQKRLEPTPGAAARFSLSSTVLRDKGVAVSGISAAPTILSESPPKKGGDSNAEARARVSTDDTGILPEAAGKRPIPERGLIGGSKPSQSAPSVSPADFPETGIKLCAAPTSGNNSSTANGMQGDPASGSYSPLETKPPEDPAR